MSYLRLFIELRREDTGEGCGQARVELQDRPGQVDCKVRCGMMGLPVAQSYDMALVCEQGGRYKEYPLGQFAANLRGQAGPMFRGSFEIEPEQISVMEFKAIVARSAGAAGRIVGYRFEPMLIPLKYEEAESEPAEPDAEVEPEIVAESEGVAEPESAAEPESVTEPEGVAESEVAWQEVMQEVEEPEAVREPEEAVEVAEEATAELEVMMERETEIVPEPPMPEEPSISQELSMPEEPSILQEPSEEQEPAQFAPTAIYVLRDLRQVDLMCGDAGRRAFQRYRHLILAQQDKANYLGIPCRFRPSQRIELADEGYTLFYTPHGEAPGFGEFGYWMKRL